MNEVRLKELVEDFFSYLSNLDRETVTRFEKLFITESRIVTIDKNHNLIIENLDEYSKSKLSVIQKFGSNLEYANVR
ncbi:MAG: hypothetical protein ACTSW1_17340 [Candidatus Hodarchaeales archaeon]